MPKLKKYIILGLIMGLLYMDMEVFGRWLVGSQIGFNWGGVEQARLSLTGWTSFWMLFVGGLCSVLMGIFSHWEVAKKWPFIIQGLCASLCICLPVEFMSGLILNVWLKLGVWDYSSIPVNIFGIRFSVYQPHLMGQISLLSGTVFFLLYPFAVWFNDLLHFLLFREGQPYHLLEPYKKLFTLK